jgi:multidrug efflux pump subunit AcrA (membrane-fusion protein)
MIAPRACITSRGLSVALLVGAVGCARSVPDEPPVSVTALRPESPAVEPTRPVSGAVVPAAPMTAPMVTVEPRNWTTTVRSQGGLVADELTVIGARAAGRVAEVAVEVGQRVQGGDVLVRLDDTELTLRVEQSAAQLGRARAALGLDPAEDDDAVDVTNAPEVLREQARVEEARTQLERLQVLFGRSAISRTDLDAAVAALAVAEATLASARQQVEEKIAIVKVQRAELALARETCSQAVVRAPFDGLVQSRHGSAPGASVREGDALVTLVRTDPLRFRGTVPERQALKLREGQSVTVYVDGATAPLKTTVARIAPVLDETSRTLLFEADIPNPDGLLRSGLFAQADIIVDTESQALVVPITSVLEFAGTEKVWLLEPGGRDPKSVPVRTGRRRKGLVEIVSGLSSGDRVVQHADVAAGISRTN